MPKRRDEGAAIYSSEGISILFGNVTKSSQDFDPSYTSEIPGNVIEKKIYDYLIRMGVRFEFKYHWMENMTTQFMESTISPAFILTDFQDTIIEPKAFYGHVGFEVLTMDGQTMARQYALINGYTVIENGIPTYPTGFVSGAKYIVWYEDEIRSDLDHLFNRDLPEIYTSSRKRITEPESLEHRYQKDADANEGWAKVVAKEKARILRRMSPTAPFKNQRVFKPKGGTTQPGSFQEAFNASGRYVRGEPPAENTLSRISPVNQVFRRKKKK